MRKIAYIEKSFRGPSQSLVQRCDDIMAEYAAEGYDLTLRQLYYQCVSRDILANTEKNYKKLGSLVSDARLAGLLAWDVMVDRTRELRDVSHWDGPGDIISACAAQFRIETRDTQDTYVEVWVEKEALAGIVVPVCNRLDVDCLVCRGYVSQSAMWQAAQRFEDQQSKQCILLHLGDHDPSGLDMTRDISDRLNIVFGVDVAVERIALTMAQIQELNPPPNPAKTTDSRFETYVAQYGDESWEMDALDPRSLTRIITTAVGSYTNRDRLQKRTRQQNAYRAQLGTIADRLIADPNWSPEGE